MYRERERIICIYVYIYIYIVYMSYGDMKCLWEDARGAPAEVARARRRAASSVVYNVI